MLDCDFYNNGCFGGVLINSIDFLESEGVATSDCVPYVDQDNYCSA
jgi:hypothetical protein